MANSLKNLVFIDIETVSHVASFEEMKEPIANFWLKKAALLGAQTEEEKKDLFFEKAGIFAEFGKIIVIGLGWCTIDEKGNSTLHVKSISDHNEKNVLEELKKSLHAFSSYSLRFCGHNIKEFDIPYICRRMSVHGISPPAVLDVAGKKPWEVNHIDTMELWKFGDRKNYTSLDLLAHLFDIPSSKSIMQNHQVSEYYYAKKDLPTIEEYCRQDVVATARLFCKLKFLPLPVSVTSV